MDSRALPSRVITMTPKPPPINSELAGQVAVVTGGGRGIGRAIAARLSAAGMTTAILARSASEIEETARTIEQSGGRARPFAADVTDAAAVAKALQEIDRSLGPVASSAIPVAYFSSYATSKAALVRFTETIAAEVRPHGISMFAVHASTTRNQLSQEWTLAVAARAWSPLALTRRRATR